MSSANKRPVGVMWCRRKLTGAVATFLLFVDLGRDGEESGNSWSGSLSNDASGRGRGRRCPDIATVFALDLARVN